MSRILFITAVEAEARALECVEARVVVGGIGRTNAAAATTEAILRHGPFDLVISTGIAGALPGSGLTLGEVVVASHCVYVEEGLATPEGFRDMEQMGFPLGDFAGNVVPVDAATLHRFGPFGHVGRIATVATCSGSDEAAAEVARRTGAVAEAMEGAAVVHAARRVRVPAIEIRAISNTTGYRARQAWDIPKAIQALTRFFAGAIRSPSRP
jgi:futalosine hydrolase